MGDRNSYMGLLRMDEVREELNVTEEQHTKIREAVEAARNGLQPPEIDFASLRDASDEERQAARAKMQEFGERLEKEVRTQLAGILDEAQMQRLRGLWVQRAGALAALTSEDIAAELKLNDDQKATLKTQRDEQRAQMRGGGGFGFGGRPRGEGTPPPAGTNPPPAGDNPPAAGTNPPPQGAGGDFLERFRAARRAAEEKALAVLTEEQKTAFAAIKGNEFTFPQQDFGGGRGGFGGRGRGEGDGDGPPRRRGGPPRDAE